MILLQPVPPAPDAHSRQRVTRIPKQNPSLHKTQQGQEQRANQQVINKATGHKNRTKHMTNNGTRKDQIKLGGGVNGSVRRAGAGKKLWMSEAEASQPPTRLAGITISLGRDGAQLPVSISLSGGPNASNAGVASNAGRACTPPHPVLALFSFPRIPGKSAHSSASPPVAWQSNY